MLIVLSLESVRRRLFIKFYFKLLSAYYSLFLHLFKFSKGFGEGIWCDCKCIMFEIWSDMTIILFKIQFNWISASLFVQSDVFTQVIFSVQWGLKKLEI